MLISFGHLLKAIRQERGLTQKTLANAIDVNASYIARLESDERRPSRRVVLDLSRALNLSSDDCDRLLASAQHLPEGTVDKLIARSGLAMTHPAIYTVALALQDPDLSTQAREQLAADIPAYVQFRVDQLKAQDRSRPVLTRSETSVG